MNSTRKVQQVLIADDNEELFLALADLLKPYPYELQWVKNGEAAIEAIRKRKPDLLFLDLSLPYVSGFEICRQLKQNIHTHFVPILVTTEIKDPEDRLKAIELGVDDFVSYPLNQAELSTRIKYLLQLKSLHDDLDTSESILFSLVEALEAKDPFTSGHSRRVAQLSCELARQLGLSVVDIDLLRKGGLLHDIGKIGVKEGVLLKEGKLDDDEMSHIKTHPARGYDICLPLKSLEPCLPIIRSHHERLYGKGYPDGLKDDNIPMLARITAVADAFDAMTENRPYRQGMSVERALSIFSKEIASGQWDPKVVKALIHLKENLPQEYA